MNSITAASAITWVIAALATAGIVIRPWHLPEAIWALAGAVLLVVSGLLSWRDALAGAAKGIDVYFFLTGMMLLAELARQEGLFDWLAAKATLLARGSPLRLFALIFGVGIVVTAFLSNDATAVVLTPAVAAVAKAAGAAKPLPYLLICAFVANAASFILPISNPANLVIYGSHMPRLLQWLPRYLPASVLAIAATYVALRFSQRKHLRETLATRIAVPALNGGARLAAAGIAAATIILLTVSALGFQLGLPTFLAGAVTALIVFWRPACHPFETLRNIPWGILPLVAGLFVLVAGLENSGASIALANALQQLNQHSASLAAWLSGILIGIGCNLVNNLPAALLAGSVLGMAHAPGDVHAAVLIGVDLGPNLSITGSLATILWLAALRREGLIVDGWTFLKLGAIVMPPALVLALAGVSAFS
ncbi:MAG TPA: arsenic transporter [Xanthobacteraceae bacterium]|nr:arsenic transporter [Xanthobacteraceae bacterium]